MSNWTFSQTVCLSHLPSLLIFIKSFGIFIWNAPSASKSLNVIKMDQPLRVIGVHIKGLPICKDPFSILPELIIIWHSNQNLVVKMSSDSQIWLKLIKGDGFDQNCIIRERKLSINNFFACSMIFHQLFPFLRYSNYVELKVQKWILVMLILRNYCYMVKL